MSYSAPSIVDTSLEMFTTDLRLRRTAVRTVLGWNVLPACALVTGIVVAWLTEDNEGWSQLFALFLLEFVSPLYAFAIAISALIAYGIATRQLRRVIQRKRLAVTSRSPIIWGSTAAVLGWLLGAAAGGGLLAVRFAAFRIGYY